MSAHRTVAAGPYVLAVSISPGGIPKCPQQSAMALIDGLIGDGRNHAKHIRRDRAVSLWDYEILQRLVGEGFALTPGAAGENLTVVGLSVQEMAPGTLLRIGNVVLQLQQPRKPCYVLDAIDPRLKEVIVGRCGYMASVVREGMIRPGMPISVIAEAIELVASHCGEQFDNGAADPAAIPSLMVAGPAIG